MYPLSVRLGLIGRWYAWILFVVAMVWAIQARGQTVSIGAGELRSGSFHRQDVVEIEATAPVGVLTATAALGFRHGERDHQNRVLPPWPSLTLGPVAHLGPVHWSPVVGTYAYPWALDDWHLMAGPRLDVDLGDHARLHVSHLWRGQGLVGRTLHPWTPKSTIRLDWRILR